MKYLLLIPTNYLFCVTYLYINKFLLVSIYCKYFTDFDEWNAASGNTELRHELLVIPARGQLIEGLFVNALDVDGGRRERAEVTIVKPDISVQNHFLGK